VPHRLLFVAVFIDRFGGDRTNAGLVLVAVVLLAIAVALLRAASGKAKSAKRTTESENDAGMASQRVATSGK